MTRCKRFPPYLVLLRVGFTLPPALPPERCALTAPFHPYPGAGVVATASTPGKPGPLGSCVSRVALDRFRRNGEGVAEAVSFLWHWPSMSLYAHVPDVIRHTALRSSDFPPPAVSVSRASGSDRPVLLPVLSLQYFRFHGFSQMTLKNGRSFKRARLQSCRRGAHNNSGL